MVFQFFRGRLFHLLLVFILGMLLFNFYIYLIISRERRNAIDEKYIQDYEVVLCGFTGSPKKSKNPNNPCPDQGIVTSFKNGGLSRNMWQYANVIAASIFSGLDAYIPICFKDTLGRVFDNLSLTDLSEIGHCILPLPDSPSSVEDWKTASQSIVIANSDLYNTMVVKFLDVIRLHFVFNRAMSDIALTYLLRARGNATDVTYIAVYITKTDVIVNQEYDDIYPSVNFFTGAMDEFRREYKNARFVVIVDRERFWKSIFTAPDVYIVEEDTIAGFGATLSILSHCNHTILGSVDIAVWGAILSGGKTIASLSVAEDYNSVIQNYKHWVHLVNNTRYGNKDSEGVFAST